MKSPPSNPKVAKQTDLSPTQEKPELAVNGLGLPILSTDAARRAHDAAGTPTEPVDLDETIRRDKEVADENAAP